MCEHCSHTLRKLVKPHDPEDCAYRKALYCGICCEYGHSTRLCRFHLRQKHLERPSSEPELIPVDAPSRPILWVVNHKQAISSVIAAYDEQPDGTKNNPKIVEKIAARLGRTVIFTEYKGPK
jgi:hypothetical protein